VCCHPTKNAESLVPRGGGAFLNEVDGNLTCKRDDLAVELHWSGKFRGPDFAPLAFQLKVVTHERLKDTDGNLIQTVVALALTDEGLRDMKSALASCYRAARARPSQSNVSPTLLPNLRRRSPCP